jgi:hypothetical protein
MVILTGSLDEQGRKPCRQVRDVVVLVDLVAHAVHDGAGADDVAAGAPAGGADVDARPERRVGARAAVDRRPAGGDAQEQVLIVVRVSRR